MSPRPTSALFTALALLTACSSDDSKDEPDASAQEPPRADVTFCEGSTTFEYAPETGALLNFPDDYFTVDDPDSLTGLRMHAVPGDNLQADAQGFDQLFADLSTLDGAGVTAGGSMTFSGPLDPTTLPDSGEGSGSADASLLLINLDDPSSSPLDVEWELVAEEAGAAQTTLVVLPFVPLQPKALHALVLTTAARDEAGDCIAPSSTMRSLLTGAAEAAELSRLSGRFDTLAEHLTALGAIDDVGDISAALTFTTQHTVEDSIAIAADIRGRQVAYTAEGACTDSGSGYRICEGSFIAGDYRVDDRYVDDADLTVQSEYTLGVTTYLPAEAGEGPWPAIIFGHGLGGERQQAEALAPVATAAGRAVIAIDAANHGAHPDQDDGGLIGSLLAFAPFFGISGASAADFVMDGLQLRDNWRQSTYDKLQLVELIRGGIDADSDGSDDLQIDDLTYLGVSLGGIMAAEFVALSNDVEVAFPVVPGSRVTGIISDGEMFSLIITFLRGSASDGDVARFFPLLQTVVDRGDSGAYGRHMVLERLPGHDASQPQVLMGMAIGDTIVPNSANTLFARAMGLPHVGEELLPIGAIAHEPDLPVSNNIADGVTGGVFQYDVIGTADATEMATHGNVASSEANLLQTLHFMDTFYDAGAAEIVDPYSELGIK